MQDRGRGPVPVQCLRENPCSSPGPPGASGRPLPVCLPGRVMGWESLPHCPGRAQALRTPGGWGVPVVLYPCDVSRPGEVGKMAAAFLRDFDTLDVLVCNAGIARKELVHGHHQADWREMLGVQPGRGVSLLPGSPCS